MSVMKKLRAALVVGATRAVAWGVLAMVGLYAMVLATRSPAELADLATRMSIAHSIPATAFVLGALLGFIAGLLFSLLLAVGEAQAASRRFTISRALMWGTVAGVGMGATISLVTGWAVSSELAAVFLLSGGTAAAATLVTARRAPRLDSSLHRDRLAP
ncbi:MAG: hypothetical protein SFU57_02345 [Gemmatimonadales bacterium]|nr:hypothetical protein [Gemmatimonadales bacterium]